jgi:glyoxylase-like metal-dependent hydrolase (beta-lactamase superfamily II)
LPELAVVPLPNGQFMENCYVVADADQGDAVLIDPGEEAERFLQVLAGHGWRLTAIWLTHAHVDHVMGVGAVRESHEVPTWLHPLDRPLYDALPQQGAWMGLQLPPAPEPTHELAAGMPMRVGGLSFDVRHVPGHSPGSVAFVGHGVAFVGDVLFSGSVGRTDLPGGDGPTLVASIRRELLTLPDSTVVYSGHGPETTIGIERETNPFLTGIHRLG